MLKLLKSRKFIKALLSMNLLALDVTAGTSAKLTAAYTPELRSNYITPQNLKSMSTSLCLRTVSTYILKPF
jgi:hypothetical protein